MRQNPSTSRSNDETRIADLTVKSCESETVCSDNLIDSDAASESDAADAAPLGETRRSYTFPSVSSIAFVALGANLIWLVPTLVSGLSSRSAHPYIALVYLAGLGFALRLTATAIDPVQEARHVNAMLAAILECGMTQKEAFMLMGYSKSQWSDICAARLHMPTHTRMSNLPWDPICWLFGGG